MRNMYLGITALVVSVGMISVGAQGRSFSGTWVIDSEKTMAAAQAAGETEGRVIAREGGGSRTAAGGMVTAGGGGAAAGATTVARGTGGGGGGAAVGARTATGTGVMTAAGGGAGGRVVVSDTVISLDATTFSIEQGGVQASYPLNGSEVTIQTPRGQEAKARASWKGDTLIIEQTIDSPNGPVTSTTSWFMEGDSLVRLTTRRTYFKKK